MPKFKSFVFDQNIFTAYSKILRGSGSTLAVKMHFSSVVLYELTATTVSADDLDLYEGWRKIHDKKGTLITPDKTDWWETGKLIRRLRFGDKSASHVQSYAFMREKPPRFAGGFTAEAVTLNTSGEDFFGEG